jgi:hypothetical protein
MGFVGLFLSMASTDPAAGSRRLALLTGLADNKITPANTTIQFEWAFDDL